MRSEHILEIRFKPNPEVLDHRGAWTAAIAKEMGFNHWKIIENRIDFRPDDKTQIAFVSFRNFGITVKDQPTPNFFEDKANKLVRKVMALNGFQSPLAVERIGVRAKTCHPLEREFSDVADHIRDVFFKEDSLDQLRGDDAVVDAAAVLYFKTELGQINAHITVNDLVQIKRLFPNHTEHPEVSWTTDMDYFITEPKMMNAKAITKTITSFANELNDRYTAVSSLIDLD